MRAKRRNTRRRASRMAEAALLAALAQQELAAMQALDSAMQSISSESPKIQQNGGAA